MTRRSITREQRDALAERRSPRFAAQYRAIAALSLAIAAGYRRAFARSADPLDRYQLRKFALDQLANAHWRVVEAERFGFRLP